MGAGNWHKMWTMPLKLPMWNIRIFNTMWVMRSQSHEHNFQLTLSNTSFWLVNSFLELTNKNDKSGFHYDWIRGVTCTPPVDRRRVWQNDGFKGCRSHLWSVQENVSYLCKPTFLLWSWRNAEWRSNAEWDVKTSNCSLAHQYLLIWVDE